MHDDGRRMRGLLLQVRRSLFLRRNLAIQVSGVIMGAMEDSRTCELVELQGESDREEEQLVGNSYEKGNGEVVVV